MEETTKDAQLETQEGEVVEEEMQEELTPEQKQEKKIKNLISVIILLAGLFVGSLFVDGFQMIRGGGFSPRILGQTDVFELNGKTWVAFNEPMVTVQVITDDTCSECAPDEALVAMRRILPTMLTQKVDAKSDEGKALIEKYDIKTIPAYVFSQEVEKTDLYAQAQQLFERKDSSYVLKTAEVGLPAGKYVQVPTAGEKDIAIGSKDAKVTVVEFSDFQCPFCKKLHEEAIIKIIKEYGDRIQFVYKQFPLPSHPQAQNAALAAACANEQGKFVEYADKLYGSQNDWGSVKDTKNTGKFKAYAAQLRLNTGEFNKCLDEQRYKDQIAENQREGQEFGIQGTPTLFVGDELQEGQVTYDSLKSAIEEQLNK